MKKIFKVPFALTMAVMLGLCWLAWKWTGNGMPVRSLFEGSVFTAKFDVYTVGDSFQCGVVKMFIVSIILTAVFLPVIALCYFVTNLKTAVQKWTFLILSLALCVLPLSALTLIVVALTRYILEMGLTAARLKGVICGVSGILFIVLFIFLLAKFIHKIPRKLSP